MRRDAFSEESIDYTPERVPNGDGHGHDLAAMADAITDRTRMVLVCNPNNPTGTSVRRAELDRFLAAWRPLSAR